MIWLHPSSLSSLIYGWYGVDAMKSLYQDELLTKKIVFTISNQENREKRMIVTTIVVVWLL